MIDRSSTRTCANVLFLTEELLWEATRDHYKITPHAEKRVKAPLLCMGTGSLSRRESNLIKYDWVR